MINICFQCGIYRADKIINPDGPVAICPECGYRHRFALQPLLIVSGASGAGKSTVCQTLIGRLSQVVILDSDILWRSEFNSPEDNFADFFDTWLRMCKNISQSGRPVALFGAGFGVPGNIEPRVERRYFTDVHYLALVCDDQALAERLRRRPKWRGSGEPAYIEEHQRFNQWFKSYAGAEPPISLLDTTDLDEGTTANKVELWINEKLRNISDTIGSK
jgi:hypothetical protein